MHCRKIGRFTYRCKSKNQSNSSNSSRSKKQIAKSSNDIEINERWKFSLASLCYWWCGYTGFSPFLHSSHSIVCIFFVFMHIGYSHLISSIISHRVLCQCVTDAISRSFHVTCFIYFCFFIPHFPLALSLV